MSNKKITEYKGYVHCFIEDKSMIKIIDPEGNSYLGEGTVEEFKANGIGEKERFTLKTIEENGEIQFELHPIIETEEMKEDLERALKRIDELFDDIKLNYGDLEIL